MSSKIRVRAGLHKGMPFENYTRLEGYNASAICWGLKSALHIKSYLDGKMGWADSPDKRFGRALHAALLEPDVYNTEWEINPGCQQPLKSGENKGKPCGASTQFKYPVDGKLTWLCKKHRDKDLVPLAVHVENNISLDDGTRVRDASDALKAEDAIRLLRARGGCEETAVAEFPADVWGIELLAKARYDKLIPPDDNLLLPAIIVDLKKVQVGKATDDETEWAIYRYGYDVKAAWYRLVYEQVTGHKPVFTWVFIEDGPPYGVNVVQCDRDTELVGELRLRECMRRLVHGLKTGDWPGYLEEPRPKQGGLPMSIKRKWLKG